VHVVGTVFQWRRWSFAYAAEVVPLLVISNNPTYNTETSELYGQPTQTKQETGRAPVAGFALSPIGFETQIGLTSHWRVYGGGATGVAWFTRDVPVPDARAFNYTFEFGAGAQWRCRPNLFLRVGYKFHHLSNAGTGALNPGLNGNVVVIGIARQLGRRSESEK